MLAFARLHHMHLSTTGCRPHPLFALLLLASLTSCGNSYRAPPPQPPPNLTVLYGVDEDYKSLLTLDTRLGVHTLVGSPGPGRLDAPAAMAIRPADGEIFVFNNGDSVGLRRQWGLVRLDRCTGFATRVGPQSMPRTAMAAMAFANDGRLFAFGQTQQGRKGFHALYQIDPDNGDFTAIGQVRQSASYSVVAADFHPDGDLYAIGAPGEGDLQLLIIIDTESGRPSVVGELGPEVGANSSIAFKPSGKLLGSGAGAGGGNIIFEIDTASATVSAIRRSTVSARGMGFAPPRSC